MEQPLADIVRPQNLSEFIGQEHLVGKNRPLNLVVKTKQLHSLIFWGPPGCGKTTLARILARSVSANFIYLSAVSAGKNDIREIIAKTKTLYAEKQTVLFLDEIHRFNKAQQDYLLPFVETGQLTLIGATTENPSFSVISPLLSRSQVFVLEPLSKDDLLLVIKRGLKQLRLKAVSAKVKDFLIEFSNGDARQLLNLLEATSRLYKEINEKTIKLALQSKWLRYDRKGEEHYDTISALIKSMRASDVNAALYYLAKMVEAGDDPLFIARRLVVFASEDIGMAQPTALVVANAVFDACKSIGYPECQENLAHGVVYLCLAKKDRSAYDAYMLALKDIKRFGNLPIPLSIRNAPTALMKSWGYGQNYKMYGKESLLPEKLKGKKYYEPK